MSYDKAKRECLAISIKHTEYGFKYGFPLTLWGYKRTADEEKRCYGGYTPNPYKAELYSIDEFQKEYGMSDIFKYDEPIKLTPDFMKKYKKYDTVFVKESVYIAYCEMCELGYKKEQD